MKKVLAAVLIPALFVACPACARAEQELSETEKAFIEAKKATPAITEDFALIKQNIFSAPSFPEDLKIDAEMIERSNLDLITANSFWALSSAVGMYKSLAEQMRRSLQTETALLADQENAGLLARQIQRLSDLNKTLRDASKNEPEEILPVKTPVAPAKPKQSLVRKILKIPPPGQASQK
jgi:hypothetical protein